MDPHHWLKRRYIATFFLKIFANIFVCTNSRHPGMNISCEFSLFRTIYFRLRVCCGSQPSQPRPGSGENRRKFATSACSHRTCLPCQVRLLAKIRRIDLLFFPVLQIRDVCPGSGILTFIHPGSRIQPQ
jgi:hypothetical protein